jgi:predicted negative regulator of RcsB-dependent stress response
MTTPAFDDGSSGYEQAMSWLRGNHRSVSIAGGALVAAAVVWWGVASSHRQKETNAQRNLSAAKMSLMSGNMDLAAADMKAVATKYAGTAAGSQAALVVAQIDFEEQKFAEGIDVIQKALGSAPKDFIPRMRVMLGDGYLESKKPAEAAKEFEAAAAATGFKGEQAGYRLKAAKAFELAGDTTKASAIWQALADDPKNPSAAAEARIRLGELQAKAAGGAEASK